MFIAQTYAERVLQSIEISVLALFLYDYSLSLPSEVGVFWFRNFRLFNLIYFVTRYLPLADIAYSIVKGPITQCAWDTKFILVVILVCRIGITATQVARTYAVMRHHRVIFSAIATLGLTSLVVETILLTSCNRSPKWATVNVVSRLTFEGAVIGPIVVQIVARFQLIGLRAFECSTLTGFFLWTSLLFFASIFALELSSILLFTAVLRQSSGILGFCMPIVATFTSRFLLHIRQINQHQNQADESLPPLGVISRHVQSALDDFKSPDPGD